MGRLFKGSTRHAEVPVLAPGPGTIFAQQEEAVETEDVAALASAALQPAFSAHGSEVAPEPPW